VRSVAFTIAAIVTAAFGGPRWAWVSLAALAVVMTVAEQRAE
jgi:hypothetical protein